MLILGCRTRLLLATFLILFQVTACSREDGSSSESSDTEWTAPRNPDAKVALVFVHGFTGGAKETWTSANGVTFFDLIAADPLVAGNVDILAFGFPSRLFREGSFDIREAANRLHAHLDSKGVLEDYPAIVFVAHSMGGLVVLRELLTHRDVLPRVPLIVMYATPQEGSQIALVAKHLVRNPAAAQMQPADGNELLKTLSDDWNSIPPEDRPRIRCAYEKRDTYGVLIVPWSSATRYCEGTPDAIDEDHIGITKPGRPEHDSVITLLNALKAHVIGRKFEPELETPDFVVEGDHSVLTMTRGSFERRARLVNAGGGKLSYTLAEFPDRGLVVTPGAGPKELGPHETDNLQFFVVYAATDSEYRFVLRSSASADRTIFVRVPDLALVQAEYEKTAQNAAASLSTYLADAGRYEALRTAAASDVDAQARIVQIVHESVASQMAELSDASRWVATADLLNAVNWPGLAAVALRNAEKVEPTVSGVPGVRWIAAETAALSGLGRVFASEAVEPVDPAKFRLSAKENPWVKGTALTTSPDVASKLKEIAPLAAQGYSLEGDVEVMKGNKQKAVIAYDNASQILISPSISRRLEQARGLER